ncbi:MAG: chemotaxis protein CheV [Magnetococcales bacterium]|nr:chemotaxis protein CheV [Magnetococcales bacterium]MBF0150309.1 chemotaxis protein CheV [Magnetococcales bacterium]MBF0347085.1 chemotaxis protein CheV [Magnetococcales bacterium]MBF0629566.1 chemotaxis protein CheV [Magnetococcales bacterium]
MEDMLDEIAQRANLAFSNQMEMLTFFLSDRQQYGINVFKIIEVIETPKEITQMPETHPAIVGAIDFRGKVVTVIDLGMTMGLTPIAVGKELSYIIVCEYSGMIQGLMVSQPNKLITRSWQDIKSPGNSFQEAACLTALTYEQNGDAIQILDIEKILGEIIGADETIAEELLAKGRQLDISKFKILVVDDSKAARSQIEKTLEQMGAPFESFDAAAKAHAYLMQNFESSPKPLYNLIISDIEMPGMDGFTFTRNMKKHTDPRLSSIPMVLHSSMSNESNKIKAQEMGADDFIPKYQADSIATMVLKWHEKTIHT